jgi:hypothetical protein
MSDLFDNLLQKSQAQAPSALAPRPVSLYEPAAGPGGDAVDELEWEASRPTEAGPPVPRYARPVPPVSARPLDPAAAGMQRLGGLAAWLERLGDRSAPRLDAQYAPLPPAPTRSPPAPPAQTEPLAVNRSPVPESDIPAPSPAPEARPTPPAQAPNTSTIVRERTVEIRPAPQAAPEPTSVGGERGQIQAWPVLPAPAVQAPRRQDQMAEAAERVPVERDVPHLVPRPTSPPLPGPRERRNRPPPPTTSLPVVNVTIGRIEVRAKRPAAPAARPAERPSPVMSLDEYLKQRQGGSVR